MKKIFIYIVIVGLLSRNGFSQKIDIIISSDAVPFLKIAESYENAIKTKGVPVVGKYNLKDKNAAEIANAIYLNNPDIVLTIGTKAAKMAKEKLEGKLMVYTGILNPEEFMASESVGISLNMEEEKKFEKISKYFISFKRCGIIYSSKSEKLVANIISFSAKFDISIVAVKINSTEEIHTAIDSLKNKIDFVYMITDTDIYSSNMVQEFLKNSLQNGLPVVGLSESYTKGGALISFDCDYEDLGAQAAEITMLISKDLKSGHKEMPRKIVYTINKHVADILNIEIKSEVLKDAKEVY